MPAKTPTYRELQDQLDATLAQLQADDIDVDAALKHYEQALQLVEQLEKRLAAAKNNVRELKSRSA